MAVLKWQFYGATQRLARSQWSYRAKRSLCGNRRSTHHARLKSAHTLGVVSRWLDVNAVNVRRRRAANRAARTFTAFNHDNRFNRYARRWQP